MHRSEPKALSERLFAPGRILALDGGGVRGLVALAFLERIERLFKERMGSEKFRLCDYYDLIGGTSTGSIIATGLALGYSAAELIDIYCTLAARAFRGTHWQWLQGLWGAKFDSAALADQIRQHVGTETLGSERLRTGLAIVAKRLDTGSVWVLHNNPRGKFYAAGEGAASYTPNRDLPLVNLIRASTAAPTYFEPEFIEIAPGVRGAFIDGGLSPHNNPSLLLVLLATLKGYGFNWPLGADKLLLTSTGTGEYYAPFDPTARFNTTGLGLAMASLRTMLTDADTLVQTLMQWMARTPTPWPIDSEIGDLSSDQLGDAPLLHYQRYDIVVDQHWLKEKLGLALDRQAILRLAQFDQPAVARDLLSVARTAALTLVKAEHFTSVFDVPLGNPREGAEQG
jgi:hypothetical protein